VAGGVLRIVSAIDLDTPVQFVRGVGPVRGRHFGDLGVRTVGDLIEHLPFRYELLPVSVPIGELELDKPATVIGTVSGLRARGGRTRGSIVAELIDGTGRCRVRWFNAPFVADQVRRGDIIRVTGKITVPDSVAEFVNPRFTVIDPDDDVFQYDHDRHEPVYPACADLTSRQIGRIIREVLSQVGDRIEETLPEEVRARRGLPPRRSAVLRVHEPTSLEDARIARRRLAYDELLFLQLAIQSVRARRRDDTSAVPVTVSPHVDQRIRARLPFRLTPGQEGAVAEITRDLGAARPMNRLLQGDVGAGKTAVAVYAALSVIAHRHQVALLAPTETLSDQHFRKVSAYLEGSRVRLALLTGSTRPSDRARIDSGIRTGCVDLLIGTHAMLEDYVAFKDLALVIIDEQHRFGVAQRAAARTKGRCPHCLVMTATPIPRTLAMTLFGDLDISTIRDRPPGRQPIQTRLIQSADIDGAWSAVRRRLELGEQAYVVYPLVEESENLPLKAATTEVDRLRGGPLRGFEVGLLHGRMSGAEKDRVMSDFRAGRLHALVSTTVIEVGVDVPNATVMVVEQAERFGLSQLHQLRGRVGRGRSASLCLLVSDSREENTLTRLRVLCATEDGFRIAEEDLKLRGPGELLGRRQHGLPELRIANLVDDLDVLEFARDDAAAMLAADPTLTHSGHAALKHALITRLSAVAPVTELAQA